MRYSTYQAERLLDRLRGWCTWLVWPAHTRWRGADPVRLSRDARQGAPAAPPPPRAAGPASLTALREREPLDVDVEAERERRAGSFLEPPYPDERPPSRIPKRGPLPAPRPLPRRIGE